MDDLSFAERLLMFVMTLGAILALAMWLALACLMWKDVLK